MFLKIRKGFLFGICLICCAAGFAVGYVSFSSRSLESGINTNASSLTEAASAKVSDKINPSTKMVYEYYYSKDGITEIYEESPPYFLIGFTLEDLLNNYPNWEIMDFSGTQVTMRTTLNTNSSQHYIIGEYNGLIAVYYEQAIDGIALKEITNIPVRSLPEKEQNAIREGIYVVGNDNLSRALSDYGS